MAQSACEEFDGQRFGYSDTERSTGPLVSPTVTDARLRRPPHISSHWLTLNHSDDAGFGVFASQSIQAGVELLASPTPAVYVIYRTFRKEVCAWCFRYERGKNWKSKITAPSDYEGSTVLSSIAHVNGGSKPAENLISGGMVFCCDECKHEWKCQYGLVGIAGYAAVEIFVQKRSRSWNHQADHDLDGVNAIGVGSVIPCQHEIDKVWSATEEQASLIRAYRLGHEYTTTKSHSTRAVDFKMKAKAQKQAFTNALQLPNTDSDLLSFLLSGALCHLLAQSAESTTLSPPRANAWEELLTLNPSVPYPSSEILYQTANSFLQLIAILPLEFLQCNSLTRETIEAILSRDTGNSFGIWSETETAGCYIDKPNVSGIEDPEMLGYGIWGSASFFNHSCSPNVSKRREGRKWMFFTSGISSLAPINTGTELCITYIRGDEDTLPLAERRKKLADGWGFTCRCIKCTREEVKIEQQDVHITAIGV